MTAFSAGIQEHLNYSFDITKKSLVANGVYHRFENKLKPLLVGNVVPISERGSEWRVKPSHTLVCHEKQSYMKANYPWNADSRSV